MFFYNFIWRLLNFYNCTTRAVFYWARAFNADISKWQTGAVTTMERSEYTNHAVVTFVECSSVCFVHSFFFFLLCVAFNAAEVFNADISKWQTGLVTNMDNSTCTGAFSVVSFFFCCLLTKKIEISILFLLTYNMCTTPCSFQ